MADFRLSDPLTFGKLDDKLETVDAYTGKSATDTLNLAGLNFNTNTDTLTQYLNVPALGQPIIAEAKKDGELMVNMSALKSGIIAANNNLHSAMAMIDAAKRDALSTVNGLKSEVTATINGIDSTIKNAQLTTMQGISSAIGSIANNTGLPISFKDVSGITGLSTNLLSEASKLGIPSAYTSFAAGIAHNGILASVTKSILPSVIGSSNIGMLNEIANGQYGKVLNKLVPGVAKSFVSSFKIQNKLANKLMTGVCTKAINSLVKIDSSMAYKSVGGKYYPSSDLACYASDDFGSLLNSTSSITPDVAFTKTSDISFGALQASSVPMSNYQTKITSTITNSDGSISTVGTDDYNNPSTVTKYLDGSGKISFTDLNAAIGKQETTAVPVSTPSSIYTQKTIEMSKMVSYNYYRAEILHTTADTDGNKIEYTKTSDGQYAKIYYRSGLFSKNQITLSSTPLRSEDPPDDDEPDTDLTVNESADNNLTGAISITSKNGTITTNTDGSYKVATISSYGSTTNTYKPVTSAAEASALFGDVAAPKLNLFDLNRQLFNCKAALTSKGLTPANSAEEKAMCDAIFDEEFEL